MKARVGLPVGRCVFYFFLCVFLLVIAEGRALTRAEIFLHEAPRAKTGAAVGAMLLGAAVALLFFCALLFLEKHIFSGFAVRVTALIGKQWKIGLDMIWVYRICIFILCAGTALSTLRYADQTSFYLMGFLSGRQEERIYDRTQMPVWEGALWIGHAFCEVDGATYTNSLEAFEEGYYVKGYRAMEVDFQITSDGAVVLSHGYGFENGQVTEAEFLRGKIAGKYTPLNFTKLLELMRDHPDVWIVTDTKYSSGEDVRREFGRMLTDAKAIGAEDVLDRLVIQIYNEKMLNTVLEVYPFRNIIFTLYGRWDGGDFTDLEHIMAWSAAHDIHAITMWSRWYKPKVEALAKKYDMDIYVHTVNDEAEAMERIQTGARGIYTDILTEQGGLSR